MAENTKNSSTLMDEMDQSQHEKAVSDLLANKGAKDLMIEKLKVSSHVAKESVRTALPKISGYNAGSGAWPALPIKFPFAMPFLPFWAPVPTLPVVDTSLEIPSVVLHVCNVQDQSGSSSSQGQVARPWNWCNSWLEVTTLGRLVKRLTCYRRISSEYFSRKL